MKIEKCFGRKGSKCDVLTTGKCEDMCAFYKTAEKVNKECAVVFKKLAALTEEHQNRIASTYYDGKMPWLEGGLQLER